HILTRPACISVGSPWAPWVRLKHFAATATCLLQLSLSVVPIIPRMSGNTVRFRYGYFTVRRMISYYLKTRSALLTSCKGGGQIHGLTSIQTATTIAGTPLLQSRSSYAGYSVIRKNADPETAAAIIRSVPGYECIR